MDVIIHYERSMHVIGIICYCSEEYTILYFDKLTHKMGKIDTPSDTVHHLFSGKSMAASKDYFDDISR